MFVDVDGYVFKNEADYNAFMNYYDELNNDTYWDYYKKNLDRYVPVEIIINDSNSTIFDCIRIAETIDHNSSAFELLEEESLRVTSRASKKWIIDCICQAYEKTEYELMGYSVKVFNPRLSGYVEGGIEE